MSSVSLETIPVKERLHLVSLYTDFAASHYVRWANEVILKLLENRWRTVQEMWKVDSLLSTPQINRMVAGETAAADILVVAISSLEQRETPLINWLKGIDVGETSQAGRLLIALLNADINRSPELEWTIAELRDWAGRRDREFFWQAMGKIEAEDKECLVKNVQSFFLQGRSVAPGAEEKSPYQSNAIPEASKEAEFSTLIEKNKDSLKAFAFCPICDKMETADDRGKGEKYALQTAIEKLRGHIRRNHG